MKTRPGWAASVASSVELAGGQRDRLAALRHLEAGGVDDEVADRRGAGGSALGGARARPTQHRPDARDQLARAERLGQVVVRAHREPDDLVDLLGARGQHQDVGVRELAHPPADLQAVEPGSIRSSTIRSGWRVARQVEGRRAVAGGQDVVALAFEVALDQLDQVRLVVDDQDPGSTDA